MRPPGRHRRLERAASVRRRAASLPGDPHPPLSRAGYCPGAEGQTLELLVDTETDAIRGAQAVGRHGADRRIDVIATTMRGGLTASDLAELELAYAAQFDQAKSSRHWIVSPIPRRLPHVGGGHERAPLTRHPADAGPAPTRPTSPARSPGPGDVLVPGPVGWPVLRRGAGA
ncbi:hypothetical protein [Mobilicoccus pelagius]|uniref:hypothetical protein n=1 Tax=Mobilicoccus pelagius TaxID=746032 RepID=UPI003570F0AF